MLCAVLPLLLVGCASSPPAPAVVVISDRPIVEPANLPAAPAADPTGTQTEEPAADELNMVALDAADDPDAVEHSPNREAMEQAIVWAREGVDLARSGEQAKALKALTDARIVLLEADLPEPMQEAGLAVLDKALGRDYAGVDLEALAEELRRDLEPLEPALEERRRVEKEARRILQAFGASSPDPDYLETFIDHVVEYIDYYRGRHQEFYERAFVRKHKYWPTIRAILTARGIPEEQGYMALVESGFNPRARSHANARGLWQFIPSTGRRYGLRQTSDFYDVVKSTEAASEYLLDLIGIFGSRSFLLAMASYNAGEGRIMGCLRDLDDPFGERTYWAIRGCLPQETRDYVPRILAAAIIGSNPKDFGFDLPTEADMSRAFDVVTIPSPTSLTTLARQAGVSVADLRTANTDLSSSATQTPVRNFPLYVPKGGGEVLIADLSTTPTQPSTRQTSELPQTFKARELAGDTGAPPVIEVGPVEVTDASEFGGSRPSGRETEVVARAGDTLVEIAARHGVTVDDLKRWNPVLRTRVLYRGDRLSLYTEAPAETTTYTVRRGDNLASIAQRHGVTVREIVRWNGLRSANRIYPGQTLELQSSGSTKIIFTVKRGNTLSTIANLFEVRIRDIMSWNRMRSSRLRAGQKLEIHPSRPFEKIHHRVRRGDTVGKIARRYGVSVASVWTANGLTPRTVIRVGQTLAVYRSG